MLPWLRSDWVMTWRNSPESPEPVPVSPSELTVKAVPTTVTMKGVEAAAVRPFPETRSVYPMPGLFSVSPEKVATPPWSVSLQFYAQGDSTLLGCSRMATFTAAAEGGIYVAGLVLGGDDQPEPGTDKDADR